MKIRKYSELIALQTFEERYNYLKLGGEVGKETFGYDRVFNQMFYKSMEWKDIRRYVIRRDNGCDLGIPDHPIVGRIIIHHMNPISLSDIQKVTEYLLNPEYLISTIHTTHNAIHYGDESQILSGPIERKPNDTCPWKK